MYRIHIFSAALESVRFADLRSVRQQRAAIFQGMTGDDSNPLTESHALSLHPHGIDECMIQIYNS